MFSLAGLVWDYFDPHSIAHQSMQFDLKLYGSAMYEYHSATGRWPASLDGSSLIRARRLPSAVCPLPRRGDDTQPGRAVSLSDHSLQLL